MVFGDVVGAIHVVVNPQAAGLVVFAVLGDDFNLEAVLYGFAVVTVVAVPIDPVELVDVELHGMYLLDFGTRLRNPGLRCNSVGSHRHAA